jgi:hypothetical protein
MYEVQPRRKKYLKSQLVIIIASFVYVGDFSLLEVTVDKDLGENAEI